MKLAEIFTDCMVLQRDMPIRVFGYGKGKVAVDFLGETVSKNSTEEKWCVTLSKRPYGGPYEMKIDLDGEIVILKDVMIGDVFLASGQSNMEMPLFRTENGFDDAKHCENSNIRYYTVPKRFKKGVNTYSHPCMGFASCDYPKPWQICSQDTALNFSAVAHYFANYVEDKTKIPIGIISCSWGGRRIEPFIKKSYCYGVPALESAAKSSDEYNEGLDMEKYEQDFLTFEKNLRDFTESQYQDHVEKTREIGIYAAIGTINLSIMPRAPKGPYDSTSPGAIWNSMLSEIVPFGLKAMLWYQGEANGNEMDYLEKYLTLLKCIRQEFENDMPVYAVELAPYLLSNADYRARPNDTFITENNWAFLREQQQRATVEGENNYLVTTQALGDMYDIHPKRKKELAERLAKKVLKYSYKMESIGADQPVYRSVEFKDGKAYITLDNAEGLRGNLRGVEMKIAGKDKVLHTATVEILDDNRLLVYNDEVKEPVLVRYGFCMYYFGTHLYNKAGLPLAPFRTDK